MHATCVTRCPALGAAAPRAPGAPSSRVSSAPGSSPRVPTLLPARHLGAAAVPIRGGVLVTHARGGGTSGTAGKQARGNRGKSRPAKPTDNTKGGKQPGAVSRAKKAVKQVRLRRIWMCIYLPPHFLVLFDNSIASDVALYFVWH